jgi:conjugal transfer pilus assembly protein TraF
MAIRVPFAILALALSIQPIVAQAAAASGPLETRVTAYGATDADPEPPGTYWRRNREGWFWYRDPRETITRPKEVPAVPERPRELIEFEAMQKRLEDLKRVAVMNPTDKNLVNYMRYQRFVMNKSEFFAERWQRLVWSVPELDYGLSGRPTNAMAITAFDEQQRKRAEERVRRLAATHGLLFVLRSDCPYCHRFAPILKRFEETFGMTVLAVTLDGRGLPEYPNAQPDNGIAARLGNTLVPALYLSAPSTREIRP